MVGLALSVTNHSCDGVRSWDDVTLCDAQVAEQRSAAVGTFRTWQARLATSVLEGIVLQKSKIERRRKFREN
jgi:hypothetical protein